MLRMHRLCGRATAGTGAAAASSILRAHLVAMEGHCRPSGHPRHTPMPLTLEKDPGLLQAGGGG